MSRLTRTPRSLLLPSQSLWDLAESSVLGLWSHWNDPKARDEYRQLVKTDVIRDAVLSQARYGSVRTMSLFHNLRNPLFQKYNFNAEEFVHAVAPALEIYQDTLGRLVHQMDKDEKEPTVAEPTNAPDDDETVEKEASSMLAALVTGDNIWRKQAQDDPSSLAAKLFKMTTDGNFDDHYYGAKLFQTLSAVGSGVVGRKTVYVAGSVVVGQVALLHAQVVPLPPLGDGTHPEEHPEFAASNENDTSSDPPVAARMDVLYEITQTFAETSDPLSTSEQYKAMETSGTIGNEITSNASPIATGMASELSGASGDSPTKQNGKKKSETALAVAVLEGWFHGGPEKDLRWKIASIRDAHEFT